MLKLISQNCRWKLDKTHRKYWAAHEKPIKPKTLVLTLPENETLYDDILRHHPQTPQFSSRNVLLLLTFISSWRRYTENGRYLIHYYMLFTPTTDHIFLISRHTKHISFHQRFSTPCPNPLLSFPHTISSASFSRWEMLSAIFVTFAMLSCLSLSLHNRIDSSAEKHSTLKLFIFFSFFLFIAVYIVHTKTSHSLSSLLSSLIAYALMSWMENYFLLFAVCAQHLIKKSCGGRRGRFL